MSLRCFNVYYTPCCGLLPKWMDEGKALFAHFWLCLLIFGQKKWKHMWVPIGIVWWWWPCYRFSYVVFFFCLFVWFGLVSWIGWRWLKMYQYLFGCLSRIFTASASSICCSSFHLNFNIWKNCKFVKPTIKYTSVLYPKSSL